MKHFIIEEKFTGYANIRIKAETEEEAIELYNEGSYDEDATVYGGIFSIDANFPIVKFPAQNNVAKNK